ncbi:hypothetical protein FRC12_020863 [Ceratobasidium sp. 428]|nr:hypothetical protein FRC12_020863 [Ceratobasidium sp. 428]
MSARFGYIQELVLILAQFSHSQTRVALLLTCRKFFHPVIIELIWSSVKGAENLLSLIEGTEAEKNDKSISIEFPDVFSDASLSRLKLYAPYVKFLEIFGHNHYDYDLVNWEDLLEYSEFTPLLPNLTQLTLTNYWWFNYTQNPQLPWLLLFASPSLLEYRVVRDLRQKHPVITAPRAEAVLTVLQRRCPKLNTLELFSGPGIVHKDEEPLLPSQCNRSAIFKVMPLRALSTTLTMLREIGDMHTITQLQRLKVHYSHSSNNFAPLSTPDLEWPNLRHLSFYSVHCVESLSRLWDVDGLVRNLTSVSLCLRDRCFEDDHALRPQLENLAKMLAQGSPHLDCLYLRRRGKYGSLENPGVLAAILSHIELKELHVTSGKCTKAVKLRQILHGRTFDCIRRLELRKYQIDLSGLLYYAQSMPNLQYLRIQIRVPKGDRSKLSVTTPPDPSRFKLYVANADFEGAELAATWEYASRYASVMHRTYRRSLSDI